MVNNVAILRFYFIRSLVDVDFDNQRCNFEITSFMNGYIGKSLMIKLYHKWSGY